MVKYVGEKDYEHGTKENIGILITNLGTPDAPEKQELKVSLTSHAPLSTMNLLIEL